MSQISNKKLRSYKRQRERRDDQKLAPNANTQKKVCGTQALDVNPFPFEKRNEKTKRYPWT